MSELKEKLLKCKSCYYTPCYTNTATSWYTDTYKFSNSYDSYS